MKRYWRYLITLISMSFASVAHYRVDFLLRIVRSIFEIAIGWITIEVLYQNTVVVWGWSRWGMLLVYTLASVVVALVMFIAGSGLESFYRKVQLGTLDYDLTRPMDAQWLASVWIIYITNSFRVLFSGMVCGF